MANSSSSVIYRPISHTPPSQTTDNEHKPSTPKPKFAVKIDISLSLPLVFNIPSTVEGLVQRIIRNMCHLTLLYVTFIWVVLLITLIPQRKFSLLLLLVTTNFGVMYLLMLRAFPSSTLLHRVFDKRLVLGLLAIATAVEMIITDAGRHLLFTLVGTVPVILLHAALQATEGFFVTADQADEYIQDANV